MQEYTLPNSKSPNWGASRLQADKRTTASRAKTSDLLVAFLSGALLGGAVCWSWIALWSSDGGGPNLEIVSRQMSHGEKLMSVDDWVAKPDLNIEILADPVGGWNLNIITKNFTFDAAAAGYENMQGHGHAHIYVNGNKLSRAYSDWHHIPKLPLGRNEVSVSLYANDHSGLSLAGKKITSSVFVVSK